MSKNNRYFSDIQTDKIDYPRMCTNDPYLSKNVAIYLDATDQVSNNCFPKTNIGSMGKNREKDMFALHFVVNDGMLD